MSTTWHYEIGVIINNAGQPMVRQTALFRLPTSSGPSSPVGVIDLNGNPTEIKTSDYGTFSRFNYVSAIDDPADQHYYDGAWGYLDCNGVVQLVASIEALNSLPLALAAQQAAQAAQTAAEQASARVAYPIAGRRLVTDPVLTYDQAVAQFGPDAYYSIDQA